MHGYLVSKLDPSVHLTPKRAEIARLLSLGFSVKQIATEVKHSHNTVAEHIHIMLKALGARNSRELVALAIAHGFIETHAQLEDPHGPVPESD